MVFILLLKEFNALLENSTVSFFVSNFDKMGFTDIDRNPIRIKYFVGVDPNDENTGDLADLVVENLQEVAGQDLFFTGVNGVSQNVRFYEVMDLATYVPIMPLLFTVAEQNPNFALIQHNTLNLDVVRGDLLGAGVVVEAQDQNGNTIYGFNPDMDQEETTFRTLQSLIRYGRGIGGSN